MRLRGRLSLGRGDGELVSSIVWRPTVTTDTSGTTQVTSSVSVEARDYALLSPAHTTEDLGTLVWPVRYSIARADSVLLYRGKFSVLVILTLMT